MSLTSFVQDRQLTILLKGEIDHHAAKDIMKSVSQRIDNFVPKICILDYREVTFMDSSGIAVVISALKQMKDYEGSLKLKNVPKQAEKVLKAAGVDRIVEME